VVKAVSVAEPVMLGIMPVMVRFNLLEATATEAKPGEARPLTVSVPGEPITVPELAVVIKV
jgi:hypothetical protein